METVQQPPPGWIGQGAKHRIHAHGSNMQPFGCLFKCDVEAPEIFPSTIDPMPSGIIPAIPAPLRGAG
jgi:hypothetical protein